MIQVTHANGVGPADLIAVARSNAAHGRADRFGLACLLQGGFFGHVVREDDVRAVAHQEILADFHPLLTEAFHFIEQSPGVDDNPGSDDPDLAGSQDADWQQRQLVFDPAKHDGVAGIVAALVAHDDVVMIGQHVDDLALGLVAPL